MQKEKCTVSVKIVDTKKKTYAYLNAKGKTWRQCWQQINRYKREKMPTGTIQLLSTHEA